MTSSKFTHQLAAKKLIAALILKLKEPNSDSKCQNYLICQSCDICSGGQYTCGVSQFTQKCIRGPAVQLPIGCAKAKDCLGTVRTGFLLSLLNHTCLFETFVAKLLGSLYRSSLNFEVDPLGLPGVSLGFRGTVKK